MIETALIAASMAALAGFVSGVVAGHTWAIDLMRLNIRGEVRAAMERERRQDH